MKGKKGFVFQVRVLSFIRNWIEKNVNETKVRKEDVALSRVEVIERKKYKTEKKKKLKRTECLIDYRSCCNDV